MKISDQRRTASRSSPHWPLAAASKARHTNGPANSPAPSTEPSRASNRPKGSGNTRGTELQLLESSKQTLLPRDSTRKQPSLYSPLGRASQAGKQGGSHYTAIQTRASRSTAAVAIKRNLPLFRAIANQLSPADASFIEGVPSPAWAVRAVMLCGI
jgi:hypothetical protein